ncbi:Fe(3+) ABC transporter substrate-binding protein [Abyssisolibacter fermentans]|uniref:Fe(3+) ABC transporter substrate-binding protein n=1 Tax=Abyssisolibacter fermentans TaxID=1766203 RepID=UPI000835AE11|nr:Fe(3+) ABC transporter substrate-binding protein [Abyssisolibacter fermentans]
MKKIFILVLIGIMVLSIVGCQKNDEKVVNIYTDRHYDTDQALYDAFTDETGIQVNVVKAASDELLERLTTEGEDTEADLVITSDAGRLYRAQEKELLKPIESKVVDSNVPQNLRESNNNWVALTMRARVIAYSIDRVNPTNLSTYEALTEQQWKGKVLVRSSGNIYNQSLLASFISLNGEEKATEWAEGLVNNMARTPEGNDRDQMKAVVAGEGDVAIVNTYYVGKLLNSADEYEVEVGKQIGVFFPNQETNGTHINISGAGLTKHGKHSDEAIKLIEYLTGEKAQYDYANANYEYPVNPNVEPSDLLKSWGEFSRQDIDLSLLGKYNSDAVKIFNKVGWK